MIDRFRIGNGEATTMTSAPSVYISYAALGLPMNEEFFNEEIQKYKIYYESREITQIRFKPKSVRSQVTSEYYFIKVDVKIPRDD